jgi:hypothetical protein
MSEEGMTGKGGSAKSASTLEKRYRRIIRCLPKAYRADRAEEMLTALLDGAAPGQTRPKIGEVLSLGTLAVRLRFGAPGASVRGQLTGDIVRRAILVSLLFGTVLSSSSYAFVFYRASSPIGLGALVYRLLQPVLFLALVFGWRRVGRTLSAVCLSTNTFVLCLLFQEPLGVPNNYGPIVILFNTGLGVLTMLAVFPAFHREAPRVDNRRWWLLLYVAPSMAIAGFYALHKFLFTADRFLWPVFYTVACIAVAAFAVKKFKASPVWPVALAIGIWPLVFSAFGGALFPFGGTNAIVLTATCGAEAVVAAAALASLVYRRRAILA